MNDEAVELGTAEEGRADAQNSLSVWLNDNGYVLCFMMGLMLGRFVGLTLRQYAFGHDVNTMVG